MMAAIVYLSIILYKASALLAQLYGSNLPTYSAPAAAGCTQQSGCGNGGCGLSNDCDCGGQQPPFAQGCTGPGCGNAPTFARCKCGISPAVDCNPQPSLCPGGKQALRDAQGSYVGCLPNSHRSNCGSGTSCWYNGLNYYCCPMTPEEPYQRAVQPIYGSAPSYGVAAPSYGSAPGYNSPPVASYGGSSYIGSRIPESPTVNFPSSGCGTTGSCGCTTSMCSQQSSNTYTTLPIYPQPLSMSTLCGPGGCGGYSSGCESGVCGSPAPYRKKRQSSYYGGQPSPTYGCSGGGCNLTPSISNCQGGSCGQNPSIQGCQGGICGGGGCASGACGISPPVVPSSGCTTGNCVGSSYGGPILAAASSGGYGGCQGGGCNLTPSISSCSGDNCGGPPQGGYGSSGCQGGSCGQTPSTTSGGYGQNTIPCTGGTCGQPPTIGSCTGGGCGSNSFLSPTTSSCAVCSETSCTPSPDCKPGYSSFCPGGILTATGCYVYSGSASQQSYPSATQTGGYTSPSAGSYGAQGTTSTAKISGHIKPPILYKQMPDCCSESSIQRTGCVFPCDTAPAYVDVSQGAYNTAPYGTQTAPGGYGGQSGQSSSGYGGQASSYGSGQSYASAPASYDGTNSNMPWTYNGVHGGSASVVAPAQYGGGQSYGGSGVQGYGGNGGGANIPGPMPFTPQATTLGGFSSPGATQQFTGAAQTTVGGSAPVSNVTPQATAAATSAAATAGTTPSIDFGTTNAPAAGVFAKKKKKGLIKILKKASRRLNDENIVKSDASLGDLMLDFVEELDGLIEVNRLCHRLLKEHLPGLSDFQDILCEANHSVSAPYGRITLHVFWELNYDFLPHYCYNASTNRFVKVRDPTLIQPVKRDKPPSATNHYFWGNTIGALRMFNELGNSLIFCLLTEQALSKEEMCDLLQASLFQGNIPKPSCRGTQEKTHLIEEFPKFQFIEGEKLELKVKRLEIKYSKFNVISVVEKCGNSKQIGIARECDLLTKERLCCGLSLFDVVLSRIRSMVANDAIWIGSAPKNGVMNITECTEFHRVWSLIQFVYCVPVGDSEHNVEQLYGEGLNWAGCVLISVLDQQKRFELLDFCYHILRIHRATGKDENLPGIGYKEVSKCE
uniref:Uncharacterized protein n=1 Tax=Romanomermis culicivorax TaxID=13658 RepID=A0A915I1B8_ROMCU